MIASANLPDELATRVARVASLTGFSTSDLVRQGLLRVATELETIGCLIIRPWSGATAPAQPPGVKAPRTFSECMNARFVAPRWPSLPTSATAEAQLFAAMGK